MSAAFVLASCGKKNVKWDETPAAVVAAHCLVKDELLKNTYSARIRPAESVEVRARVGGYLESVDFKRGDIVKKGDTLFKIDARPFRIARDAAAAAVEAANSKIALCRDNFARAEVLFKQNAMSLEAYQTRRTELLVAQAKLLEAKAALENAELNLEYTHITAPVSGRISENYADCGNLVAAHATPLARIENLDTVRVYFEINADDAVRYKNLGLLDAIRAGKGPKVVVRQKGDGRTVCGRVDYCDPSLAKASSSLLLYAEIPNGDGALMAGAFADITVGEEVVKGAMLVPEEAVGTDLADRYVTVVAGDSKAEHRTVKTGEMFGEYRHIKSGITPADLVVVKGMQRASHGAKVSVTVSELGR